MLISGLSESGDIDIPEIEVAKSIISKTIFKFNPDNYPNPGVLSRSCSFSRLQIQG
jgi:hypothetical protein